MKLHSLALAGLLALGMSVAHADTIQNSGTQGLGFGFPTNGATGSFSYTTFTDVDKALRMELGLSYDKKKNVDGVFGFSADIGYRMYSKKVGNIAAFWQPGIFVAKAATTGAKVSLGVSASIGAEYFFNSNLSFGVHTGLNLAFANSFDDIKIQTGTTAVTGTFYW